MLRELTGVVTGVVTDWSTRFHQRKGRPSLPLMLEELTCCDQTGFVLASLAL